MESRTEHATIDNKANKEWWQLLILHYIASESRTDTRDIQLTFWRLSMSMSLSCFLKPETSSPFCFSRRLLSASSLSIFCLSLSDVDYSRCHHDIATSDSLSNYDSQELSAHTRVCSLTLPSWSLYFSTSSSALLSLTSAALCVASCCFWDRFTSSSSYRSREHAQLGYRV
mgnify:CR=1 FL=1